MSGPGPTAQNRKAGADRHPKKDPTEDLWRHGAPQEAAALLPRFRHLAIWPHHLHGEPLRWGTAPGGDRGGCRHRGVRPGPWPLGAHATPASSACHPQKGRELAAQSKDNRTRQTRHAFPEASQHPEAPRSLPTKGARVSGKA